MKKSAGQKQHREQRDGRKSKELQDLKSENHALKKQVSRLRRMIRDIEIVMPVDEPESKATIDIKPPTGNICTECFSVKHSKFQMPTGKTLHVCLGCGKRVVSSK